MFILLEVTSEVFVGRMQLLSSVTLRIYLITLSDYRINA
jgi:hypothetical protein